MQRAALIAALLCSTLGPLDAAEDEALVGREAVTTAKERLVNKAADPQRVNDCNVPVEKRDPERRRPTDCAFPEKDIGSDTATPSR